MFILSGVASILHPVLGLLANLYTFWLNVVAMQAAHSYSLSRAFLTVLIPVLVVIALVACCIMTLSEAVGEVFERIQDDLDQGSLGSSALPHSSHALPDDGLRPAAAGVDACVPAASTAGC
jgi:hypothetical protein